MPEIPFEFPISRECAEEALGQRAPRIAQQFCFGALASIATARTVLGFPAPLRRSQMRVAWAFSVFLLALFLLEGLGVLALHYRAVLIPVALMAPTLSLHNRRSASA